MITLATTVAGSTIAKMTVAKLNHFFLPYPKILLFIFTPHFYQM
jgi:hypothetical protein